MIDDPLGLLDRDLRDYNTRYDTFVSNADEVIRLTDDWYKTFRDEHGEPGSAANSDRHHGYYRMIDEYPRWHTMRRAYQEAWPLATSGGGGGHQPGPVSQLRAQRHYFVQEDGTHFTAIVATDFCLQKLMCEGQDVHEVLKQRQACGFNMVRVFIAQDWSDPAYRCTPAMWPNYYERLGALAQVCADHGLYLMATAFADHGAFPSDQARLDHWQLTIDTLRPFSNALLELVNENDATGHLDPNMFPRPDGILSSHGSNGSQSLAVRPSWDFEVFHTNAAPEEQRKVGHNAMEMSAGTPEWFGSGVPIITNETSRYPEVGMWTWGVPSLQRSQMLAYDSAAGAALQCAGSCFHSVNGKLSRLWDSNEEEVARAWAEGGRSVPLEFQDGAYRRDDNLAPDELRKYGRQLGDGRAYWVTIHR